MTTRESSSASATTPRVHVEAPASRAFTALAADRARAQRRQAAAVRERVRRQLGQMLNSWAAAHGLASTAGALQYHDVLELVLQAGAALYGDCRSVSLTSIDQLSGDQNPYTTAAATGGSSVIDAAQHRLNEGPCIEATEMDLLTAVYADDLATADAHGCWPRFSEAAGTLGVRSSLSVALPWSAFRVGLQADQRAIGSINFYSSEAHAFDQSEVKAMMFGAWVGSILTGKTPAEVYEGCF
ncbi:GAF domain-containing protein [Actinomycetospora sp. TBRC 11914]|uniref:GAF domain-containing protein n=1 Tax=Actinomycetospora sp. TBRC 11914 TaxID=2729387 RepID=UPI00145C9AEE|nr:GAF domain-containing protein [Actinomycetospora sp. TBRC 11914]NMO93131.1 hypothetical protein [Actinomycetospora sp. TBRC 11914]